MSNRRHVVAAIAPVAGLALALNARAQTDVTWDAGSGNWGTPTNWNPQQVPNNMLPLRFNAFLRDVSGTRYTVTLDLDVTIDDFTLDFNPATLDLTTFNLTMEADYTQDAGVVMGGGPGTGIIRVRGASSAVSITGGTLRMVNEFRVEGANATVDLSGATLEGVGDFRVDGGGGTLDFNGPLCEICDTDIHFNGQRVRWNGGSIGMGQGSTFTNGANSAFEALGDNTMVWDNTGARPVFQNDGTLLKTTGTGVTRFTGVELVNDGTLDVASGTVRADTVTLGAGNTLDRGTWIVRDNATLNLPNAPIVVNDAAVELRGAAARFGALVNNLTDIGPNGSLLVAEGHRFAARAGDFTNDGVLAVDGAGSLFTVAGGLGPANFVNGGTAEARGAGRISVSGDFTNNGALTVGAGSDMLVEGAITNFSGGVFTGGAFTVNGRIRAPNLDINTVESELNYDDPSPLSGLVNTSTGQNALFNLDTIGAAGRLRISNGRSLGVAANLALSGELTLGQGLPNEAVSVFTVPGTLTQAAGVLRFGGGRLNVGTLELLGGRVEGNGTVNGRAVINGVIEPGGSPGQLRFVGDLVLSDGPGAALTIELAGLVPVEQYDRVAVSGEVSFESGAAGVMTVSLMGGFTPAAGDLFRVMRYGSRRGAFEEIQLPSLPGGLEFRVRYQPRGLVLAVVPAPGAGAVAALALALGVERRRRSA